MPADLPHIPVHDAGDGGLGAYALREIAKAEALMDAVLKGFGPLRYAIRPLLGPADRLAQRHLARIGDPYLAEIEATREAMGRPGAIAFALSYEAGCTARVFPGDTPCLFRTLDWPFKGIGDRVEILRVNSPAGPWITATWPGLAGILHGAAPGRFLISMNQAPQPMTRFGRAGAWVSGKLKFLQNPGLPPMHLLRHVFETAPDYETAAHRLTHEPLAAPAIFTLAGPNGAATVIERTETECAISGMAATNHFNKLMPDEPAFWRARGYESEKRYQMACEMTSPPALDDLPKPVLNPHTRLAMTMEWDGTLRIAGYEGPQRVTEITTGRLVH
ncbi:MAG: carcinine hydrolase/isopenicillin-N N-acyltransferase family protein [Pseudomonadota bacterium]